MTDSHRKARFPFPTPYIVYRGMGMERNPSQRPTRVCARNLVFHNNLF